MQKAKARSKEPVALPCCGVTPPARIRPFGRQRAGHLADILRALGHPLRLDIIACLSERERNVGSLAEQLKAKPAIVSQQLRILRSSRLVTVKRQGGLALYSLELPQLRRMVCCLSSCPYLR
jgi:DNA-binding transcriptional ArsR family regulator